MNSMRTLLFLNTLPLAFRQSSWYRWRSIFLASLYLLRSLLSTLILCIQSSFWFVLALALELALAISLISLGSSHTFFFPHFITSAARRFWSFSELILGVHDYLSCRSESSNF